MRLKDKLVIAFLGILIFVFIGANACTYFSIGSLDLILVAILGVLVFVETGAIACSISNDRMLKRSSI